jgi:DNA (cytosine-5)-methyltransferase 1
VPTRLGFVAGSVLADELERATSVKRAKTKPLQDDNVRVVYLQSHVRTRKWFKDGQTFVWADGDDNMHAHHPSPITERRVRSV